MDKLEIIDEIEKIVYITQPSPVVLVSTIDKAMINNLAPFAMFMNCSTKEPQMVAIAISPKTDTYKNIKETKQFIVSIPNKEILPNIHKCGEKFSSCIDEFEISSLTKYPSPTLKCSRVKECSINIDCIFEKELETGNHFIVVGKVIGCDMDKELYKKNKTELRMNIPRIYHITGNQFLVDNEKKEV